MSRAVEDVCRRVFEAFEVNLTSLYYTNHIPNLGVLLLSSIEFPAFKTSSTRLQIPGAFNPVFPFDVHVALYSAH